MNVPGQNHRDPWFAELYKSILEDTKFVYQTKEGTPFIFPGTGTGGWEVSGEDLPDWRMGGVGDSRG